MYQKKCCEDKHVDLLLIREEGKRHYVLIKDFDTFMYHTLHRRRKHFCRFCLQAFSTEEILKRHYKTSLKSLVNKELSSLKRVNTLNSKILKKENHHL